MKSIKYQVLSSKYKKSTFGFSLIELLVVIAIMITTVGIGYMAFDSIIKDRQLKNAEKELRSLLYQAKQGAFYGKKPAGVTCDVFLGNEITVDGTNVKYESVCFNDPETNKTEIKSIDIVDLDSGNGSFIFNSVGSENKTTGISGSFDFFLDEEGKNIPISVDENGEIR